MRRIAIIANASVTTVLIVLVISFLQREFRQRVAQLRETSNGAMLEKSGVKLEATNPRPRGHGDQRDSANPIDDQSIIAEVFRRGSVPVKANMAHFLQVLSIDGMLRKDSLERMTTAENADIVLESFDKLRRRLWEIEAEVYTQQERDGRSGVLIPPVFDLGMKEVKELRLALQDAFGAEFGEAYWGLVRLTPDFVGMSGERFITFRDEGDRWALVVEASGGIIDVQPRSLSIPKESTESAGVGVRYAHILNMEQMLQSSRNRE